MSNAPRYRGFISYSHRDKAVADWLHKALETYRIPPKLVGRVTDCGPVPKRLAPIFRDRSELPAADDLGTALRNALAASSHLIVICSPASARSKYVDQEVATFKRLHGERHILALIADGEPNATDTPEIADQECFPPSLRFHFGADGEPTDVRAEPIAADIRPGKDGKRLALLKLVAGMVGIGLDDLAQRDLQRRARRLAMIATGAVAGMVLTTGLAFYANQQRAEAVRQRAVAEAQRNIAARESAAATSAADFLIGTFALSNPQTENPRTITALTILDRGAARARTELATQPRLQARLAATLGGAYQALGLLDEAEGVINASSGAIDRAGPDGAFAQLRLADIHRQRGETDKALALIADARKRMAAEARGATRLAGGAAAIEGRIHAAKLETKQGIASFDRAIAAYAAARDARPSDIVIPMREKGSLLSDDGQFAAADKVLLDTLAVARRELGDAHRVTASVWIALAQNAFQQEKYDLAAQRLAPAIPILRRVVDPNNTMLADAVLMQGQIELGQKRYAGATRSIGEALAVYRRVLKGPNQVIGIGEVYLALARGGAGDLPGALAAFDSAKVEYDASYGKLHANHGDLLVNRATVLARFGRMAEARADCARGLEILNQTLGANAGYTRIMAKTCANL